MKFAIIDKKDNSIFGRTELKFEVNHPNEKTPSRLDVSKLISANVNSKEDLISIYSIKSIFGSSKSIGLAHIYKKEADMNKNELSYILKRMQKSKEKSEKPATNKAPEAKPSEETPTAEEPTEAEAKE